MLFVLHGKQEGGAVIPQMSKGLISQMPKLPFKGAGVSLAGVGSFRGGDRSRRLRVWIARLVSDRTVHIPS